MVLKKPLISIIIPASDSAPKDLLKEILVSVFEQKKNSFEVLVITSKANAQKISDLKNLYPALKILTGDFGKSQARNFGSQKAQGNYLLHLDHNLALSPKALKELESKAKKGTRAVVAPVKVKRSKNFLTQIRAFEHELISGDEVLETPIFFEKTTFEKVGGYDPELDPLDDWGIHLALEKAGVKLDLINAPIYFHYQESLLEALKRKYRRGRAVGQLKKKYPHLSQISLRKKIALIGKNWRKIITSPLLSLGLFFLKILEYFAFLIGRLHPKKNFRQNKDFYQDLEVARTYDEKRLGKNFGLYKHYTETQALFKLLEGKRGEILEIGCGTGRITQELAKKGLKVTPTDPSRAMLLQFQKKKGLPKPILATGESLPFGQNKFPIVLGIRVIWHILEKGKREKVFFEATRVGQKYLIFDFANRQRTKNLLVRTGEKIYETIARPSVPLHSTSYFFDFSEITKLAKKHEAKICSKVPLDVSTPIWLNLLPKKTATSLFPLLCRLDQTLSKIISPSRLLILFEKKKPLK